jgi:hypothetical protein
MLRKILFFAIAAGLTVIAVFVQQIMDNDFPYRTTLNLPDKSYTFSLPKVNEGVVDCIIELTIPDPNYEGYLYYKMFGSNGNWKRIKLLRLNDKLVSILPYQKPMVKLMYYLEIADSKGNLYPIHKDNPLIVLFRNQVPRIITYSIALLFFVSLIFSSYAGIVAVFNVSHLFKYIRLVFYLLLVALMLDFIAYIIAYQHILVEPSPHNDLRFYKNLIILILWSLLYFSHRNRPEKRFFVVAVSLLTLLLFVAPDHLIFRVLFNS